MPAVCIASRSVAVKRIPLDMVSKTLAKHPWLWTDLVLKARITPAVKVAAIALLKFINSKKGHSWASYKTIASTCGTNDRGIRFGFTALCAKDVGLIKITRCGAKNPNQIELTLPPGLGLAVETGANGNEKVTVVTGSSEGRQSVKVMVVPASPIFRSNSRLGSRKEGRKKNITLLNSGESCKVISIFSRLPVTTPIEPCPDQPPDDKPYQDRLLPPAHDDEKAIRAIRRAAMNHLGIGPADRKTADKSTYEAVCSDIPAKVMAEMVQKCRQGRLGRAEIGQSLAEAGIGPKLELNRRTAS